MTTEQLDAIATKLLGWKRARCPIHGDSCPEAYYHRTDGTQGHGWLDVDKPKAAMLVLEAMGEWCDKTSRPTAVQQVQLTSSGRGWVCEIVEMSRFEDDIIDISELGNTIPEAVFQCAAKLVERM